MKPAATRELDRCRDGGNIGVLPVAVNPGHLDMTLRPGRDELLLTHGRFANRPYAQGGDWGPDTLGHNVLENRPDALGRDPVESAYGSHPL